MEEKKMRLFKCDIDGIAYWVAAETVPKALELALADYALGLETVEEMTSLSVDEVAEGLASNQRFHSDECGGEHTIWSEFGKFSTPGVIACSVW